MNFCSSENQYDDRLKKDKRITICQGLTEMVNLPHHPSSPGKIIVLASMVNQSQN